MPIVFACACAHAPGITGWPQAAAQDQRERFHAGYRQLGADLRAAAPDAMVAFTSEHWANFFLDNYPAFCVARARSYEGPIETAINIPQCMVPGDVELANEVLESCFESGFEPSVSDELILDHGTMVPLHFLTPHLNIPLVPIVLNSLSPPLATLKRCYEFGRTVGSVLARTQRRVAVVATGGLSHSPGTPSAGRIDRAFDAAFLRDFCGGEIANICDYRSDVLRAAGFGAHEIRNWLALAGAVGDKRSHLVCYEPVVGWSTGCALVSVAL